MAHTRHLNQYLITILLFFIKKRANLKKKNLIKLVDCRPGYSGKDFKDIRLNLINTTRTLDWFRLQISSL